MGVATVSQTAKEWVGVIAALNPGQTILSSASIGVLKYATQNLNLERCSTSFGGSL